MPLIEGIGDEVTVGCGLLFLLCLVLLAWFSTHTRDIPFVSIIVVELSQRRHLASRNRGRTNEEQASASDTASTEALASESDSRQNAEGDATTNLTPAPTESDGVVEETISRVSDNDEGGDQKQSVGAKAKDDSCLCPAAGDPGDVSTDTGDVSADITTTDSMSAGRTAEDSVQDTCSQIEHPQDTNNSPDEVRKRRVAYFETTRGKEYSDLSEEPDLAESNKCASAAEPATEKQSAEGLQSNAASEESRDSSIAAGQTGVPESVSEPVDGEAASSSNSPASDTQQIRVRLKYLNDTQRLVYARPEDTIGNFRRTHFSEELGENKIIRFIFNGQDLRNDLRTLSAYNVGDNSVIHCLITQSRQQQETADAGAVLGDEDGELGVFIYPIFGLVLGILWYFRFSYKQYFNAVSTVSLAGVSFIYCLALVSSLRSRQHPHQHLD